jgi:hypothetical protein
MGDPYYSHGLRLANLSHEVDRALEVAYRRVARACTCPSSTDSLADAHGVVQVQIARALHLLRGALILGNEGYGIAVGTLARAMFEVLVDTASMVKDLPRRALLFGHFAILEEQADLDERSSRRAPLPPGEAQRLSALNGFIARHPAFFSPWTDKVGKLQPAQRRRWSGLPLYDMCEDLGTDYISLYRIEYRSLSSTSHGSGLVARELDEGTEEVYAGNRPLLLDVQTDQRAAAIRFLRGLDFCVRLIAAVQFAFWGTESQRNRTLAARVRRLADAISQSPFRKRATTLEDFTRLRPLAYSAPQRRAWLSEGHRPGPPLAPWGLQVACRAASWHSWMAVHF